MSEPEQHQTEISTYLLGLLTMVGLLALSGNYLLFHVLSEGFSIVVACGIFLVAWNVRRLLRHGFVLLLGVAYLCVGLLDLLHTLSYQGMGVWELNDANIPTQLWIAARGLQALSMLAAAVLLSRRFHGPTVLGIYLSITAALGYSIYPLRIFPDCFLPGTGLTNFKIVSEYVICLVLAASGVILWMRRWLISRGALNALLGSLAVAIAAELCFTLYTDPYGRWNLVGHLLKIVSFYLLYRAVLRSGMIEPYLDLSENLGQSEQRYRTLVELSPEPLMVHDGQRYIYANQAACHLLEVHTREEIIGLAVGDSVCPEDRAMIEQPVASIISPQEATPLRESRILTRRGNVRDVEAIGAPITFQGRAAVQVIMRDITQRVADRKRQMQLLDELKQANEAKDHFLAVLSHELRTPLTPMLVAAEAMENDPRLPGEIAEDIRMILRNIRLEARLIDDLLDLTRITRGKLVLDVRTVDLASVLRYAVDICRHDAQAKKLQLELRVQPGPCWVRGDAPRLHQILWNLVKNAVKFTPESGTVRIDLKRQGNDGLVRVADSGIGIDAAMLPKVFDAFEQGDRCITKRFGGLGLGLAISKSLVQMQGGGIDATSDGPGHGATFTVQFPCVDAPSFEADVAPDVPPAETAGRKRILFVEDHPDTARLMTRLLRGKGYDVRSAGSMAAALSSAREYCFDLLISDLGLPDGSGLELIRQLHQQRGAMKAIALSGYGMQEDIARSREAGFTEHLTKPIDFQKLHDVIVRLL